MHSNKKYVLSRRNRKHYATVFRHTDKHQWIKIIYVVSFTATRGRCLSKNKLGINRTYKKEPSLSDILLILSQLTEQKYWSYSTLLRKIKQISENRTKILDQVSLQNKYLCPQLKSNLIFCTKQIPGWMLRNAESKCIIVLVYVPIERTASTAPQNKVLYIAADAIVGKHIQGKIKHIKHILFFSQSHHGQIYVLWMEKTDVSPTTFKIYTLFGHKNTPLFFCQVKLNKTFGIH